VSAEGEQGIYISVGEAEVYAHEFDEILSKGAFEERYDACMKAASDYDVCTAVAVAGGQLRQAVDDAAKEPGVRHVVSVEGYALSVTYVGGGKYEAELRELADRLNVYWISEYRGLNVNEKQVWYVGGKKFDLVDGASVIALFQELQRYLARVAEGGGILYREAARRALKAVTSHLDSLSKYVKAKQAFLQGAAGNFGGLVEALSEPSAEATRQRCLSAFGGADLCGDVAKFKDAVKLALLRTGVHSARTYIIDAKEGAVLSVELSESSAFIRKMGLAEFVKSLKYEYNTFLVFGGREYKVETEREYADALRELKRHLAAELSPKVYGEVAETLSGKIREAEAAVLEGIKTHVGYKLRELERAVEEARAAIAKFENADLAREGAQYLKSAVAQVVRAADALEGSKPRPSLKV